MGTSLSSVSCRRPWHAYFFLAFFFLPLILLCKRRESSRLLSWERNKINKRGSIRKQNELFSSGLHAGCSHGGGPKAGLSFSLPLLLHSAFISLSSFSVLVPQLWCCCLCLGWLGCCHLLSEWGMWRPAYRTVAACGWLVQYVFVCVDDPSFANKEQQRPVNPTHHMPFCSLLDLSSYRRRSMQMVIR